MNNTLKLSILLAIALIMVPVSYGQDPPPRGREQRFEGPFRNEQPPNLLAQLGLTKEQVQQFRRTNAEHRPLIQAAQQRMREANRELDIAIYSDTVSEDVFRAKLRAFQEAQFEVNNLRFANELAIRKILTPDQLVRFREMRRRFAEARDRLEQQRRPLLNEAPSVRGNKPNAPEESEQKLRPTEKQRKPVI